MANGRERERERWSNAGMAPTHRRWRTGPDRALKGAPLGLLVLSYGIFPRGSGQAPRTCLFTDFRGVSHVALQPRRYVALGGQARSYYTAAPEPEGLPRCLTDAAPSASIKQASQSLRVPQVFNLRIPQGLSRPHLCRPYSSAVIRTVYQTCPPGLLTGTSNSAPPSRITAPCRPPVSAGLTPPSAQLPRPETRGPP